MEASREAAPETVAKPLLGREIRECKSSDLHDLSPGDRLERAECTLRLNAEEAEIDMQRLQDCWSFAKKAAGMLHGAMQVPQGRAAVITVAWVLMGLYMYTSSPWDDSGEYYTIIDSMYVMAQIITTVGYGDMCAKTKGHLLFTSLYVLTAVLALSSIAGVVAESIVRGERELIQVALEQIGDHVEEGLSKLPDGVKKQLSKSACPDQSYLDRISGFLSCLKPSREMMAFLRAVAIWASFVAVWILFFCFYPWEQRDFMEAFYMAVITLTTVGFGDKTPVTQGGKLFATFWMIGGVGAFANLLGKFATMFLIKNMPHLDGDTLEEIWSSEHFKKSQEDRNKTREIDIKQDNEPKIHRDEFIVFVLQKMEIVDEEIIAKLSHNFDQFDKDGNGYLDEMDTKGVRLTVPRIHRPMRRSPTA